MIINIVRLSRHRLSEAPYCHGLNDVTGMIYTPSGRFRGAIAMPDTTARKEGFLSIFQAVEKNHVFVLNACSSLSREQLERSLMKPVSGLISSVLEESPESAKLDSNGAAFISSFFSYAFIGIMLDWIDSGMREKPEDLVEKIECVIGGSFERAIPRFVSLRMKLPVRIPDSGGKL